ncbi:MAG: hypothetical protein M1817_001683 [Caeruleum heppii]|nr:MAG: hypothetical protein M1817_001683 [Caeruleum heppii]
MPHEAARVRDPAANDFGQSLSLEIVIPQTPISELDKDAYTSVDPDNDHQDGSAMPGIAQRNLLFFDETLPVLILLRTSCLHEEELRAQLARITLALEAYVVNTPPRSVRNSGNGQLGTLPATRELICSRVIPHTEDPTVILRKGHNGGSEPDAEDVVFVVWQTDVRLRMSFVNVRMPMDLTLLRTPATPGPQSRHHFLCYSKCKAGRADDFPQG